jgi:hypothetical protein
MNTDKRLWRNRKAKKELARRLQSENPALEVVPPHAAGIDVGNRAHYPAVRPDRDWQPVRRFECFTADLYRLTDWLQDCGVKTVALQSTGVYWTGRTRLRGLSGQRTAHQESARTEERCAGKPVATETTHLRLAEQLVPTNVQDPDAAYLLAAATTTCGGSGHPCATYAESPNANEYLADQCDQRSEWGDRTAYCAGHHCRETRPVGARDV